MDTVLKVSTGVRRKKTGFLYFLYSEEVIPGSGHRKGGARRKSS